MTRRGVIYCCILWLSLTMVGAAQEQEETLDNQAVVKMVQAHLGADLIVAQIQKSPGKYTLTTSSLIRLKQQSVPDKVIAAMQAKASESRSSETKESAKPGKTEDTPTVQRARSPYTWEVANVLDRMTNKHHAEGLLRQRVSQNSPEELQIEAKCDDDGMHWLVIYLSGTNPGEGYKLNYPNSGGGGGGGIVLGGIGGVIAGVLSQAASAQAANGPWVVLQVKIDQSKPMTLVSTTNYKNYALVNFARQEQSLAYDPQMDQALRALQSAQNRPAGTMMELANADRVLVALPREDDTMMYVEVRPHAPSFARLLTACGLPTAVIQDGSEDSDSGTAEMGAGDRKLATDLSPAPRSAPMGKGTVKGDVFTDASTGLMWATSDSGHGMPFAEAKQYCTGLRTGGYSNWRLPDSDELKTVYDPGGKRQATCPGSGDGGRRLLVRPEINLSCYWMWSSTKGRDIAQPDWAGGPIHTMGIFNFYNGTADDAYPDKKENAALCVRKSR